MFSTACNLELFMSKINKNFIGLQIADSPPPFSLHIFIHDHSIILSIHFVVLSQGWPHASSNWLFCNAFCTHVFLKIYRTKINTTCSKHLVISQEVNRNELPKILATPRRQLSNKNNFLLQSDYATIYDRKRKFCTLGRREKTPWGIWLACLLYANFHRVFQ